jgi:hypothetical protein
MGAKGISTEDIIAQQRRAESDPADRKGCSRALEENPLFDSLVHMAS